MTVALPERDCFRQSMKRRLKKRRWSELSAGTRRFIVIGAVVEGALKVAALVDLRRRPADEVNGSKRAWAVAIVLVNSLGAVPMAYFLLGRRKRQDVPGSYSI